MRSPASLLVHPSVSGAAPIAAANTTARLTPLTHRRRLNVTLVFVCQAFHSLTFIGLALFLPMIREDMNISYAQAGMLSVAATLSYALGQIPAGFLADRHGPRRLFFVGIMGWSILLLVLGMVHGFWPAVTILFVAGAFRTLLFAPGLALLASWYPPEQGAMSMSLYMLGAYTGNILLALAGPALTVALGWRTAIMLFAVAGVCGALLFHTFSSTTPPKTGARPFAMEEALHLLRNKVLWTCSAIQIVRFSAVTGFVFWLPSMLVADRGFSLQAAGFVVAMSAALSAVANPLGGYLSGRLGSPSMIIGSSLAGLAGVCVLLTWVESTAALLFVIACGSVFVQIYFGPLYFVPVEAVGPRAAGTAIGFSNLFANLGGLLTAYALGMVKDLTGSFKPGFLGISALCIIGVLLSVALSNMHLRRRGNHAATRRPE